MVQWRSERRLYDTYSILNRLKINNWTKELIISNEYIIKRRYINKGVIFIQWLFIIIIIAIVNDVIDKEPAGILIDERLDKVKDWEIIE